jgi:dienelactone hydrolase
MTPHAFTYQIGPETYTGFLADGSGGRKVPGVLVAHEGGGFLTEHAKDRARMVAELGYVAFALDLFGDPRPTLDEARKIVQQLRNDLSTLRARATTALDILRQQSNVDRTLIAAIGFCFGGTTVLELARSGADVACTVGFHAGLTTTAPAQRGAIRGKVLVCQGADDPIITAEHRNGFAAEMTQAGVDWQMHVYGGVGHSFTNPEIDKWNLPGFTYDSRADRRSWLAMRALLEESLGYSVIAGL